VTVAPDVARIARKYGIDPQLIQAVCAAEGNIVRAVQCSYPAITTREEALDITCRSAVHAMSDWIKVNAAPDFVAKWGERWAPDGANNDPTHLNRNWSGNVLRLWLGLH
jgi:hypothetical protein